MGRWLAEVGVVAFFVADGCGVAMSGIYDSGVGECEEAVRDAVYQRLEVAAREVGAADAAVEEGVADYDKAVCLVVKSHAAKRMPRHMDNLELAVAYLYDFAVREVAGDFNIAKLLVDAKHHSLLLHSLAKGKVETVGENRHLIFILEKIVAYGMVEMQMRVYDMGHYKMLALYKGVESLLFFLINNTRVDYGASLSVGVVDYVGVDAEEAELEYCYFHYC